MHYLKKIGPKEGPYLAYFFSVVLVVYLISLVILALGIVGALLIIKTRTENQSYQSNIKLLVYLYLMGSLLLSVIASVISMKPLIYRYSLIKESRVEFYDELPDGKKNIYDLEWGSIAELRISKSNFLVKTFFKKEFSAVIVNIDKPYPKLFSIGGCSTSEVNEIKELFLQKKIQIKYLFD